MNGGGTVADRLPDEMNGVHLHYIEGEARATTSINRGIHQGVLLLGLVFQRRVWILAALRLAQRCLQTCASSCLLCGTGQSEKK